LGLGHGIGVRLMNRDGIVKGLGFRVEG
jgi:hypothetical protein